MKTAMKVLVMLAVLIAFVSFEQCFVVNADPSTLESKTLAYVKNVLPFDMSRYNITVSSSYSLPSAPNDPTITQAVVLDLKSSDSSIHVVSVYVNGALHQCAVRPTGTPVSDKIYDSMKDVATRILQAHQEQTGLDSTVLLDALSLVNDAESTNVAFGDVNLSVSKFPDIVGLQTVDGMPVPVLSNSSFSVSYNWMETQNGITRTLVALSFDNGIFYNLQDERAINPTSNTISSVSEQQVATPTPTLIAGSRQENSTSPTVIPQPTNGTYAQTNQLSSESLEKTADQQNSIVIPFLIVTLAVIAAIALTVVGFLVYFKKHKLNLVKKP